MNAKHWAHFQAKREQRETTHHKTPSQEDLSSDDANDAAANDIF